MRRMALLGLLLAACVPAGAVERIRIEAGTIELQLPGQGSAVAHAPRATLTLPGSGRLRVQAQVARLALPAALTRHTGAIRDVTLACTDPVVHEPAFSCPSLSLRLRAARLPPVAIRGRAALRSDTGAWVAAGEVADIAGSTFTFDVRGGADALGAEIHLPGVQFAAARELAASLIDLPAAPEAQGEADLSARLVRRAGRLAGSATVELRDAGFQNADATWIAEKVAARITGSVDLSATPMAIDVQVQAGSGQFLGGVVLLDFDRNPLEASLRGHVDQSLLQVQALHVEQRDLAQLSGTAEIALAPFAARHVELDLQRLQFPAAYTSYMQLLLATTPFNQLQTAGTVSGRVTVRDNAPAAADLRIDGLDLSDASRQLDVREVNGELHWSAGATGPPRPSFLSWADSRGWGIEGGAARLDFATSDRNFQLIQPARLPFFDGALVINTLRASDIGLEQMAGAFDAVIEPISVRPIARALGWPEFSGQLSGRIPGLTYRDQELELAGNLEADVFDGRVVASNLRVSQPLSAWPRLHADIIARNLDLNLITSTFEFGSITGRLDVDLTNLETFNWSPTAFDLRMGTPPGDRSRHRISQRAVQNLSSIGGGGGGVAAALQSGLLRFFDEFRYARLGISCRLRNDVCEMDGVGPAGTGYYIVRGSGIPRIDIIGNEHRVDWPRLVAQISSALSNTDGLVIN